MLRTYPGFMLRDSELLALLGDPTWCWGLNSGLLGAKQLPHLMNYISCPVYYLLR